MQLFDLETRLRVFRAEQEKRLDEFQWVPESAKSWSGSYDTDAAQFFSAARRGGSLDDADLRDLDLQLLAMRALLYAIALIREPSLH